MEIVLIYLGVHQPFRVAKHGDGNAWSGCHHLVQTCQRRIEFRRAGGVQNHHIGLGAAESPCKGIIVDSKEDMLVKDILSEEELKKS